MGRIRRVLDGHIYIRDETLLFKPKGRVIHFLGLNTEIEKKTICGRVWDKQKIIRYSDAVECVTCKTCLKGVSY